MGRETLPTPIHLQSTLPILTRLLDTRVKMLLFRGHAECQCQQWICNVFLIALFRTIRVSADAGEMTAYR